VHENTLLLFDKYAREYFGPGVAVLEIGPDRNFKVRERVAGLSKTWDTIDVASRKNVTYTSTSEYEFPIPDARYDVVIATNVLEHVRKIWVWVKELRRVCSPTGHVIIISPVSWPYHTFPVDCWRAYPEGMKALFEDAGLRVILSVSEALADAHVRRSIPGRSQAKFRSDYGWRMRALSQVLVAIGYPSERAFDVITIGTPAV
jgi:SAM-dependent methyltransferase